MLQETQKNVLLAKIDKIDFFIYLWHFPFININSTHLKAKKTRKLTRYRYGRATYYFVYMYPNSMTNVEQSIDADDFYSMAFFERHFATHCLELEQINTFILNLRVYNELFKFLVIREKYLLLHEMIQRYPDLSRENGKAILQFAETMTKINKLHKPLHFICWLARTDPKAPLSPDSKLPTHAFDDIIVSAELQENIIVAIAETHSPPDIIRALKVTKRTSVCAC